MLTEQEVSRRWRSLFAVDPITRDEVDRAQSLIDQLRPESPLRHRLDCELEEICKLRQVSESV